MDKSYKTKEQTKMELYINTMRYLQETQKDLFNELCNEYIEYEDKRDKTKEKDKFAWEWIMDKVEFRRK